MTKLSSSIFGQMIAGIETKQVLRYSPVAEMSSNWVAAQVTRVTLWTFLDIVMLEDKGWEDPRSVNSPRRILSFSKNRKATVFFPDPDDRDSGFGVSGDQGPKTSEVYGFVGSITTVVATVLFLVWAYLPEHWLHSLGIVYYPSRYWALAAPAYAMMTISLAVGFYIGLNFLATPPPTSFSMIYDEFTREPLRNVPSTDNDEQPIEPISDIRIDQINDLMFNPR